MEISEKQVEFTFSRSSGPGGQNVNKVNTQVTGRLDIVNCACLTQEQKELVFKKLANRIDKEGKLQITGSRHRSQQANRLDVLERMGHLITAALVKPKVRKPTKISYAAKQRRLKAKKNRSEIKKLRNMKAE